MNAGRGITVTTNGGTIVNTDTGGTWTMGSVYSTNTPVTFVSAGGTIHIAAQATTNILNLGMGALVVSNGNIGTASETTAPIFSNLVVKACTFTFNYDVTSGQSSDLGAVPSSFSQSNIWISGGALHVGHSTTISANRGVYLASGTPQIEDVTGGGTVTIASTISGPGSVNFPLGKSGSTTAVVLSGNNTYTGATTVGASCTVTVGGGGTTGTLGTGNTTDSGTLAFNRTGTYTYGGVISGAGVVNKTAAGVVTLTGKNTYTGATTISAGTLLINTAGGNGATALRSSVAVGIRAAPLVAVAQSQVQ